MRPATEVRLTDEQREELQALLRASTCTVAEQRRARIALLAAEGLRTEVIAVQVEVPTIDGVTVAHTLRAKRARRRHPCSASRYPEIRTAENHRRRSTGVGCRDRV